MTQFCFFGFFFWQPWKTSSQLWYQHRFALQLQRCASTFITSLNSHLVSRIPMFQPKIKSSLTSVDEITCRVYVPRLKRYWLNLIFSSSAMRIIKWAWFYLAVADRVCPHCPTMEGGTGFLRAKDTPHAYTVFQILPSNASIQTFSDPFTNGNKSKHETAEK